jgi:tetratricopeptide (TPR) repeat protein
MKYLLISLFFWATSQSLATPDFQGQFNLAFQQGNFPGMEATLRSWESTCPDDVEMLEAYGSYYYNQSKKGATASQDKLVPREDITLAGKTAKTPDRMRFNRDGMLKAADYWKKAIRLYPWRLDLCFWLAHLYQDMDDFEAQYQTLAESLQYADKNRKKLRWEKNAVLPERASKFIPESMQSYENYYFGQQKLPSDEKAFRLAKLIITFFPNHPSAYNSMAAYFWFKNDWEHALKYLIIANQKDPRDCLVLNNIGNILVKLNQRKEAKIYYRKVVRLNQDGEYVANAKKRLEELGEN